MSTQSHGWAVVVVILAALVSACTAPAPGTPATPVAATPTSTPEPVAGTPGWQLTNTGPEHAIEGFADRTSVAPGQPVQLFVSTTATGFTVTAYRFGAYQGSDALAIWTSPALPGRVQPAPVVQRPRNTVVARWDPSLTIDTAGWAPGTYLLRLDASSGEQRFVPLTVRTTSNSGRVVIINAVTTWQAYNPYGGYSLYKGPDGRSASTAPTRPTSWAPGSSCSSSWPPSGSPNARESRWATPPTSTCTPTRTCSTAPPR